MFHALHTLFTSGWFLSTLLWIALAWTIVIIIIILSENRNPVKSLAWVTVLLLLPVVGLVLYLVFGRNIRNLRMVSRSYKRKLRRRERRVKAAPASIGLSEQTEHIIRLGHSVARAQIYAGTDVSVFDNGKEKFEALLADLRNAVRTIHFQYYIFSDDETGHRVAEVLMEKARMGVKVRVIYDHLGSFGTSSSFFRQLRKAGVEVVPFFRITVPGLLSRLNWRNHRKVVVIDDSVAYVGGMNVADRYVDGGKFPMWRDLHLRVTGPVVAAIQNAFVTDWSFTAGESIDPGENLGNDHFASLPDATGGVAAQLITAGPTGHWANIAMMYHKAIANARRRVYIQTPYFLPTEGLLKALQSVALSGVDVRVMMPRRSDSLMLTRASASYIASCLQANIKLYFFEAGMLHSKMLLVDDEMVSIGSSNFDFRSFDYNFELTLFCFSKELNERLASRFHSDMALSTRVYAQEWKKRPATVKLTESLVRLISPIL